MCGAMSCRLRNRLGNLLRRVPILPLSVKLHSSMMIRIALFAAFILSLLGIAVGYGLTDSVSQAGVLFLWSVSLITALGLSHLAKRQATKRERRGPGMKS